MFLRSLHDIIASREDWESSVMVIEKALSEIRYWSDNLAQNLIIESELHVEKFDVIFCDASDAGYGVW